MSRYQGPGRFLSHKCLLQKGDKSAYIFARAHSTKASPYDSVTTRLGISKRMSKKEARAQARTLWGAGGLS